MLSLAVRLILGGVLAQPAPELPRLGTMDTQLLPEISGIVASRRHPGVFWAHSDSGNPPLLFALRRDGTRIRSFRLAVPNVDWEDIALDDAGHLYVGDTGNNGGRLPVRVVHGLDEPDPAATTDQPLRVKTSSYYHFGSGTPFDSEGLVIDRGRIVLISKRRDGQPAELFDLPIDPPAPLLRPALPRLVGSLPGAVEPITGADLTADGRWLAVCSLAVVRVYERADREPNAGDAGPRTWRPAGVVRFRTDDQIEAVAWEGPDLILAGEKGGVFRVTEARWRAGRPDPASGR